MDFMSTESPRPDSGDGPPIYAVTTTGIYCRTGCPSRRPRPENVRFFASGAEAERAGFRPCKRCRPDAAKVASPIAEICRLIAVSEEIPGLDTLARTAGLGRVAFQRGFKAETGLAPGAYIRAERGRRARLALEGGGSVTGAIYEAGFGSSGRFYAQSDALLGMTPTAWRSGGKGEVIRFALGQCSLGAILVAATERGICEIALGDAPEPLIAALQERFPRAALIGDDPDFASHVAEVVGFVEAPEIGLRLPLDIRGTAFQRRVWQALQTVPPGERLSYTELASRLGLPRSVRAVASACASNRIAIAIPCHRIMRIGGGLAGFRWGLARKQALLEREKPPGSPSIAATNGASGQDD